MQTRLLGAVNSNVDLLVLREKAAMTSRLKFCRIKNTVFPGSRYVNMFVATILVQERNAINCGRIKIQLK